MYNWWHLTECWSDWHNTQLFPSSFLILLLLPLSFKRDSLPLFIYSSFLRTTLFFFFCQSLVTHCDICKSWTRALYCARSPFQVRFSWFLVSISLLILTRVCLIWNRILCTNSAHSTRLNMFNGFCFVSCGYRKWAKRPK